MFSWEIFHLDYRILTSDVRNLRKKGSFMAGKSFRIYLDKKNWWRYYKHNCYVIHTICVCVCSEISFSFFKNYYDSMPDLQYTLYTPRKQFPTSSPFHSSEAMLLPRLQWDPRAMPHHVQALVLSLDLWVYIKNIYWFWWFDHSYHCNSLDIFRSELCTLWPNNGSCVFTQNTTALFCTLLVSTRH